MIVDRRAVPAASAAHSQSRPQTPAASGAAQLGRKQFTTMEMLRTPQFYWMYVMFVLMATGGLLVTANAGTDRQVVGTLGRRADAGGDAESARQRRQPRLLGLGVGSPRTRERRWCARSRCRRSASRSWWCSGRSSGVLVRERRSSLVYFTWGEIYSLFPSVSGRLLRHAPCDVELRRALHGEGRRVDHRPAGLGALLFEQTGSWAMGFYGSAVMALVAAGIAVYLRAGSPSVRAKATRIPATA